MARSTYIEEIEAYPRYRSEPPHMTTAQPHKLCFSLPRDHTADELPALFADLFGVEITDNLRPVGYRNAYRSCYVLETAAGDLLVMAHIDGAAKNRGTTFFLVEGLALDPDSSLNPLDLDLLHVAQRILAHGAQVTQLHLAVDDRAGLLPWRKIVGAALSEDWRDRITTPLCKPNRKRDNRPTYLQSGGQTLYFGKKTGETSICLYRKDLEQQVKTPWLRVELRLTNRVECTEIIRRLADGDPIGPLAAGLLAKNLKFLAPGQDKNKSRRPLAPWWSEFIGHAEAIRLPRTRPPGYRSPWRPPSDSAGRAERYLDRLLRAELDPANRTRLAQILADAQAGLELAAVGF